MIQKIREICKNIINDIDHTLFYSEYCYQSLLDSRLTQAGFTSEREVRVEFKTKDDIVYGFGLIDILIETESHLYILELKANHRYMKRKAICQTQRYLLHYPTEKEKFGLVVLYNCNGRAVDVFDVPQKKSLNIINAKLHEHYPKVRPIVHNET